MKTLPANARGFTLIELLISIAILAIIVLQAVPAFREFSERSQTRTVTNQLIGYLNYARAQAIHENHSVIICSSSNGKTCRWSRNWSGKKIMVYVDINNDNRFKQNDDRLLQVSESLPEGSHLRLKVFRNKPYIKWLSTGMTDSQQGNFTYCPPSRDMTNARHIIWNVSGRVYDGLDSNGDGIVEDDRNRNIRCR